MKYYNELEQSWRKLKEYRPEEAKAIGESEDREYLDCGVNWTKSLSAIVDDLIYRAPVKEKQPLGPEDIKQGDAIKHKGDTGHEWYFIEPRDSHVSLAFGIENSYEYLASHCLIRSIGETNWRPCHK
tara:strand:- start:586 stop:966 length:381 start_codon:yes stop_codon:yes gene_type:complete